jgi:hypothetical protein
MGHPYYHSLSSAKKHGGVWTDYIQVHNWFDETKAHFPDFRHRALRHHSEGIFLAEHIFGVTITNSEGRQVPVRVLGEQHVKEDLGRIPTAADWLKMISPERWMGANVQNLDFEDMNEQERSEYQAEAARLHLPAID